MKMEVVSNQLNSAVEDGGIMIVIRRYSERDEKQLRELIFPEEDRRPYTSRREASVGTRHPTLSASSTISDHRPHQSPRASRQHKIGVAKTHGNPAVDLPY
jgi:hypothetical protein